MKYFEWEEGGGCDREVPPAPRAEVPGDGRVRPLRPRAVHRERHEVLRVGERDGPLQVRRHGPDRGGGGVEEEQLLAEVGGLSAFTRYVILTAIPATAISSVCHVSPGGRLREFF